MTERDAAQSYLDKKFEGYTVIPNETIKKMGKHLGNEMKGVKFAKTKGDENLHRLKISAMRFVFLGLGILSEEEISNLSRKASVKLSDEEKSFERAVIACQEYMTACRASPEVLLEGLKAELTEE
jgi:hypothetical protein